MAGYKKQHIREGMLELVGPIVFAYALEFINEVKEKKQRQKTQRHKAHRAEHFTVNKTTQGFHGMTPRLGANACRAEECNNMRVKKDDIMNFELKTLDLTAAARLKTDVLVVLVSVAFKPSRDPVSDLIAQARKSGDLDATPAKLLSVWRADDVIAGRVLLVSTGEGHARQVRQAVTAAVALL